MAYLILKVLLSGLVIAAVSEIARRSPAFGALVASLPLISILGIVWLWRDTRDPLLIADHAYATFWYVLPSLPMFLLVPWMLRQGVAFGWSLCAGVVLTILLYAITSFALARMGVKL
ncbi:MAG: hypothetical protein GC152_11530 [Alphaproteobacteria bacterium]|nr:hypothetical protein [Alphaproteobacteria bacterium]